MYLVELLQAVQSIMGATGTFLSKVNELGPVSKSESLLVAGILLEIRGNYTLTSTPSPRKVGVLQRSGATVA
jgi:hypothetical protein